MARYTSWIHGNALTVESPQHIVGEQHFGWGADMSVAEGQGSWFHMPLPTPVIVNNVQAQLLRVYLRFSTESGDVRAVHVYHGSNIVQEYNNLNIQGDYRSGVVQGRNTFSLDRPHPVVWGIGLSFFFQAQRATDTIHGSAPPPRLIVATAGGDYVVPGPRAFATRVTRMFAQLIRR